MNLSDFDFTLPESQIALRPMVPRGAARLLAAGTDWQRDLHVRDLPDLLVPGDLLIVNDTKVIPARLTGQRRRGTATATIEVTLLEPRGNGTWLALLRPLRKVQDGEIIDFCGLTATMLGREGDAALIAFDCAQDALDEALDRVGRMPLPPYIERRRMADQQDRQDYQTGWAVEPGAVAAPTASLHFDAEMLSKLAARGVETAQVTLHVGAGTFLPVKVADITQHQMHAEFARVGAETVALILKAKTEGRRVIAVGTTALRAVESAARSGQLTAFEGKTDIFITPGYSFRVIDGLWTNFHLPQSTLLMLVAALMGRERVLALYAHAIATGYRFFSYGDACLFLPGAPAPEA